MFGLMNPKDGTTMRVMQTVHDYVLEQLAATKGTWPEVAKGSGVPYRTIKKIANRLIESPRVNNLEKLAAYFRDREEVAA